MEEFYSYKENKTICNFYSTNALQYNYLHYQMITAYIIMVSLMVSLNDKTACKFALRMNCN